MLSFYAFTAPYFKCEIKVFHKISISVCPEVVSMVRANHRSPQLTHISQKDCISVPHCDT